MHQLWTPEYNLSIDVWTILSWSLTLSNLSYLQGGCFEQPRPQGFSLKKWVGFEGKDLGTRLCFEVGAYSRLGANRVNTVHAYIDSQREIFIEAVEVTL